MNSVLEDALSDLILKVTSGVEEAGKFMAQEIPDVINQLLLWYGVSNFIYFIIGICGFTLFPYITYKIMKKGREIERSTNEDTGIPIQVFVCLGGVVSFFSILGFNLTWLKIWIAPKIWLIEYAATLTKQVTG